MANELFTKAELIAKFGWEEYVVFAVMLLVSALIGLWFMWRSEKSNADFLMGGGNMGVLPVSLSLLSSFISAITLLGTPAEVYVYGTQYCMIAFCFPFVMLITAYWFLPVYIDLGVSTSYEYLEWRFGKAVRTLASACFILQMVIFMAIVVFTPALALSQLTGFDVDIACGVIFIVCIFYTSIGGIKAVIWTDVFQTVTMFASFLAVIIKGTVDAGGVEKVFNHNYQSGRIELLNISPDPTTRHSLWCLVLGGIFLWLSIFGINQAMFQRYLTVSSVAKARRALWCSAVGIISIILLCGWAGMVIFAYYQEEMCDPLESKLVKKRDQLLPLFVMQVFGDVPFLPGLFVAGVFSGALSSVSSGLNSLAAVTIQDFIQGMLKINLSDRVSFIVTQGLAVLYGILSFLLVFAVKYVPGVLQAGITIFGVISGPVLGCFILGLFFPWANSTGTIAGLLSSFAMSAWLGFGQTLAQGHGTYKVEPRPTTVEGCPKDWNFTIVQKEEVNGSVQEEGSGFNHLVIYEISYMWFCVIPVIICFIIGAAVSMVHKPQDPKLLNPSMISPGFRDIFSWWPKRVRQAIDDIQIGLNYVPTDKEETLRQKQISVPGKKEDVYHVENPNEKKQVGEVNLAVDMTEM